MSTLTSRNAKKILDHQGKEKTLARGLSSFVCCNASDFPKASNTQSEIQNNKIAHKKVLILGLGYNINEDLENVINQTNEVYGFEYIEFSKACESANIKVENPKKIQILNEDSLFSFIASIENLEELAIYIYRQNLALFPNYWNKIFLKLEDILKNRKNTHVKNSEKSAEKKALNYKKKVLFATFSSDLMHYEVKDAIEENGYSCLTYTAKELGIAQNNTSILQMNEEVYPCLKDILQKEKPDLFLSINGRFLDANGRIYSLLEHLKIPLALWIVDNVWNILSAFKSDFWKECHLFVTDSSFIPKLKEYGAKNVHYLPLAGTKNIEKIAQDSANISDIALLYVGHSAFKDKVKFFSAVQKDTETLENFKHEVNKHYNNTKSATLPNFHSISSNVLSSEKRLWGSNDFREISYITSEIDLYNKTYWLNWINNQSQKQPHYQLTILGDNGWNDLLNNPKILPPVDYYTALPKFYNKAKFTLNIPSMLMPSALTQRHFDVWLSNGFLLSAPTKGLEIFTSNAQESMLVENPTDVLKKIESFIVNERLYNNTKKYMCDEIERSHLYKHRIATICSKIGL